MMKIEGKTALVAGGGRGIGEAISRALARQGAKVWILDTNTLRDAFNHYGSCEIGGHDAAAGVTIDLVSRGLRAESLEVDATCETAVIQALDEITDQDGPPQFVVNALGISQAVKALDSTTEQFESIIRSNLLGHYILSREAARRLIAAKLEGSILNLGSIAAKYPFTDVSAYAAAKAAIAAFSTSFAVELAEAETGIQVNTLCPGMVRTNMWTYLVRAMKPKGEDESAFWKRIGSMIPQRRFQTAEATAEFAIAILCNTEITGQSLSIDGGLNRHA